MDQLVNGLIAIKHTQYHRGPWTADKTFPLPLCHLSDHFNITLKCTFSVAVTFPY